MFVHWKILFFSENICQDKTYVVWRWLHFENCFFSSFFVLFSRFYVFGKIWSKPIMRNESRNSLACRAQLQPWTKDVKWMNRFLLKFMSEILCPKRSKCGCGVSGAHQLNQLNIFVNGKRTFHVLLCENWDGNSIMVNKYWLQFGKRARNDKS